MLYGVPMRPYNKINMHTIVTICPLQFPCLENDLSFCLSPILISRKRPSKLVKFEFEQFSTIEDVFLYLVSVAPYMK
ncbi:MAG TPA: hypothetical protein VEH06_15060, partial [Candidatus Bathyarchaeia archaeon]|nr:hypothetical protein [Candidatus Bathyarchaeia archaeon]